jgi:aspartate aminotransferase
MIIRSEIQESLTLKFAESANERRKKGLDIISLGLGEPEFPVPNEILQSTINILSIKKSGYSSPLGVQKLREQIAEKLKIENGINCDFQNIIITPGSKQALQLILMALLKPNDEVIVLTPAFVSFIPQIYLAEPNSIVYEVDVSKIDYSISFEKIEKSINSNTKLLILNTPNNPAGYMFSEAELKKLYELAELHDFYIVSDEIYEKINFSNHDHFSIGSLEDNVKRIITINGFSKSHSMTGWRLGYACFPKSMSSDLLKIQQHVNTNTCTFIQEGLSAVYNNIDYSYLIEYNKKLKNRIDLFMDMVNNTDKISAVKPQGGFFGFLNIAETKVSSNQFCSDLILETGVALTPGIAFGNNWDDHVRISFATEDLIVEKGLALIKEFVEKKYN